MQLVCAPQVVEVVEIYDLSESVYVLRYLVTVCFEYSEHVVCVGDIFTCDNKAVLLTVLSIHTLLYLGCPRR